MKKITKEFNIYNFNELTEEAQKKAIEKEKEYREEEYIDFQLENDMIEEAKELLKNEFKEIDNINVYYDLSYSQGSGSMIEFTINIKDLNDKYNIYSNEELKLIQDKGIVNDIKIYHNDNLYYHEYTFSINWDDDFGYYDYDDIKEDYNINENDFNDMENKLIKLLDSYNKHNTQSEFIQDIIKVNKELTKYGYECIEYFWDDANIIEYCNEHLYYENGEIYEH